MQSAIFRFLLLTLNEYGEQSMTRLPLPFLALGIIACGDNTADVVYMNARSSATTAEARASCSDLH